MKEDLVSSNGKSFAEYMIQYVRKGSGRERYNREPEELYNEPNIVNVIKSSRLRSAGHVVRMNENELPKKIFWTNPGSQQGRG